MRQDTGPRLAFVLFHYFPYGGLQRDFLRILRACQACGAEVKVFAMRWEGERPAELELIEHPGKGLTRTARRRDFAGFVGRETGKGTFDAVVGFNRMPGLDWYYAADSCFADKAARRGWLYRLAPRSRQYLEFERAVCDPASATRLLMISPLQAAQYLRHYAIGAERLIELPPGIGEDRKAGADAAALRRAFRREFGLAPGEKLVLQVGSGYAVKGVDRSLRALASLPEPLRGRVRYFLVGQDDPRPYLRLAGKLGIASMLRVFAGRDDIPRFLQGADLLLHPAYSESAGLVLLEAVVAGLPVLCTDTCGYAVHVEKARAGRVCPSPFRQESLNAMLRDMLGGARLEWRRNGIRYGREQELYHMPEMVAGLLCGEERRGERGGKSDRASGREGSTGRGAEGGA